MKLRMLFLSMLLVSSMHMRGMKSNEPSNWFRRKKQATVAFSEDQCSPLPSRSTPAVIKTDPHSDNLKSTKPTSENYPGDKKATWHVIKKPMGPSHAKPALPIAHSASVQCISLQIPIFPEEWLKERERKAHDSLLKSFEIAKMSLSEEQRETLKRLSPIAVQYYLSKHLSMMEAYIEMDIETEYRRQLQLIFSKK